jgi:hypothetical protein
VSESILGSTKKGLGLAEVYEAFDPEITVFINMALGALSQIGVDCGNVIVSDFVAEWSSVADGVLLGLVRPYVLLKVKSLFDPSANPTISAAIDSALTELTWRITNHLEVTIVPPVVEELLDD